MGVANEGGGGGVPCDSDLAAGVALIPEHAASRGVLCVEGGAAGGSRRGRAVSSRPSDGLAIVSTDSTLPGCFSCVFWC